MRRARTTTCLGIIVALLAASSMATPALAGKADNSVRFAYEQTPPNIDPYFNGLNIGTIIANSVWDTLIYRDPVTGAYKGSLATAWRWVDDRTLELDLRRGVRFHNGAEFSADDVVYTLSFVAKPENKAVTGLVRWISRVEKLGTYKVRIVSKQPYPAVVATLAAPPLVIHPHDYYAKVGPKGVNERPVGTGPYRVVEHALGKHVRLERYAGYFADSPKAQPKIDTVEIRFIPDSQTRVAEIIAGSLDLITNVSRDQAEQLRHIPTLQIAAGEITRYALLGMNTLGPAAPTPLRDVRVRQAIMHAIDRETMTNYLVGGGARVLHVPCHPTQFGCSDAGIVRYDYNPAKAKQLLAEAGYANGFDIEFYAYRDRNQTEAIIGYLRAIGIRARLRYVQAGAYLTALRAGSVALHHTTYTTNTYDASNTLGVFFEFGPNDRNRDPEIRDLLVQGDAASDPEARKAAYAKALSLIAERAYVLPLYALSDYSLANADLVFTPYSDTIPRFYEMSYR